MKKLNISKEFLVKEYVINKKSTCIIAKEIKCDTKTIWNYLNKYNITIRSMSEIATERFSIPENVPAFKDGRTLKTYHCIENCGRKINWQTAIRGSGRCSLCEDKHHSNAMSGSNNPNFGKKWTKEMKRDISLKKGGTGIPYENNKYPQAFNSVLKDSIRTRDNFECQNCGMTEEEHLIVVGRVLEIHHIDYNKKNCNKDNLITMCKSCNMRANHNRDYWEQYFKSLIKENNYVRPLAIL